MTFRFCGHIMGDQQVYMPKEELAAAVADDPLPRFRAALLETGAATVEQIEAIERAAAQEVADAAEFALAAPLPDPAVLTTDVYTEGVAV